MAEQLLDELNNFDQISFELDLGFSVSKFTGGYRKRFHAAGYQTYNLSMLLEKEDFELFQAFYVETLEYGTKDFTVDLNIGDGVETFTLIEVYDAMHVQNNNYRVSFSALKKEEQASQDCLRVKNCVTGILFLLQDINPALSSNISASEDSKKAGLCLYNLTSLLTVDINEFKAKAILLEEYAN